MCNVLGCAVYNGVPHVVHNNESRSKTVLFILNTTHVHVYNTSKTLHV